MAHVGQQLLRVALHACIRRAARGCEREPGPGTHFMHSNRVRSGFLPLESSGVNSVARSLAALRDRSVLARRQVSWNGTMEGL